MTVRRLNFTDRETISRNDVDILIRKESTGAAYFDANLRLSDYGFPPDARVFIEAYRQTTLSRFDFGSVSVPRVPEDRLLRDFESTEQILFRVRVTAVSGNPGMLLGELDQIRPREPGDEKDPRIPLLPPVPADLDEEVWRVEYEGDTYLKVSRHLPDWKQTVMSAEFRALVYPSAMRQILDRILFREQITSTDDYHDWRCRWLKLASELPGSRSVPKATEDYDDWIEEAVAAFARQMRLRSAFQSGIAE